MMMKRVSAGLAAASAAAVVMSGPAAAVQPPPAPESTTDVSAYTGRAVFTRLTVHGPAAPGNAVLYPLWEAPKGTTVNFPALGAGAAVGNVSLVANPTGFLAATTAPGVKVKVEPVAALTSTAAVDVSVAGRTFDTRVANRTPAASTSGVPLRAGGVLSWRTLPGKVLVGNLIATGADAGGHAVVYPCSAPPPAAASINFTARQAVSNLVVVPTGADGRVCVRTSTRTHLVFDTQGLVHPSVISAFPARRVVDTRIALGSTHGTASPVDSALSDTVVVRGRPNSWVVANVASVPVHPNDFTPTVATVGGRSTQPPWVVQSGFFPMSATQSRMVLAPTNAAGEAYLTVLGSAHVVVDQVADGAMMEPVAPR